MTAPLPRRGAGGLTVCLVGAGGVRAPATVEVLIREAAEVIAQLRLWEPDAGRRAVLGVLAARRGGSVGSVAVRVAGSLEDAISGADLVAIAIRPGGDSRRVRDEEIARSAGVLAQETIGFGGFALALRSIPAVLEIAHAVHRCCPGALLVNLTNPVGVVGEALAMAAPRLSAVGLCDTPRDLVEDVRRALAPKNADLEYAGLNHLGGITTIHLDGVEITRQVLQAPGEVAGVRGARLWGSNSLWDLGAVPSEYVWFYRYPHSLARRQANVALRGEVVAELSRRMVAEVADALAQNDSNAAWRAYCRRLGQRSKSYLSVEERALGAANKKAPTEPTVSSDSADDDAPPLNDGYASELAAVVRAHRGALPDGGLILNVPAPDAMWGVGRGAVVEGRCVYDAGNWRLLAAPGPQGGLQRLVRHLKEYEQRLAAAVIASDREGLVEALAINPAVGDATLARELLEKLLDDDAELRDRWN